VARTPRLSPQFLARRNALGIIKRSPESRAIAATIVALCTSETLPGPGDAMTLLEPADARGVATLVRVRRVRGLNLWIWGRGSGARDTNGSAAGHVGPGVDKPRHPGHGRCFKRDQRLAGRDGRRLAEGRPRIAGAISSRFRRPPRRQSEVVPAAAHGWADCLTSTNERRREALVEYRDTTRCDFRCPRSARCR